MTKPKDADEGFDSSDCSSSVSNPFYYTEFTTASTAKIEAELRKSGFDVDAFLKRCGEAVENGYRKALEKLQMPSTLEKVNVYKVSRLSPDDGYRITIAWFSTEAEALRFSNTLPIEHMPNVNPAEAYLEVSQYGGVNYYIPANGEFDELPVDREIYRKSGLEKLTLQERKALGV